LTKFVMINGPAFHFPWFQVQVVLLNK
jgi:hypothetical protein